MTEYGEVRHPLIFHMLDVGLVVGDLWRYALHGAIRRLFIAELGLSEEETAAWLCCFSSPHDIGKASPAFQRQSDEVTRLLQARGFTFQQFVDRCPHGIITADVLTALLQAISIEFPRELGRALGLTVGGHHGVFGGKKPGPGQKGTEKPWVDARHEMMVRLARLFGVPTMIVPRFRSRQGTKFPFDANAYIARTQVSGGCETIGGALSCKVYLLTLP